MKPNQWNKYGKKITYIWERPIFEHLSQKSRADMKNGVFELYYNAVSNEPINPIATQKKMGRAFKHLFNADKYICVVSKSRMLDNGEYKHNVQFYFKPEEIPSEETMAQIEKVMDENTVIAVFKRTSKDHRVKYFEFSELPGSGVDRCRILQMCNGEIPRTIIQGGKWDFA